MADADEDTTVAERLGRLLDRGLLPAGGPAEAAERLIERLQRPARVALLGLPGSGKSAVLNLLAGAVVVPETLRLPSIIVQHGDEPKMHCTLSDGQTVTLTGDDLEKVLPLSPALVTLELNLPALRVIGLLEVAAGPMEAEQRRAALWAGKRADIIIWCSTAYLPKEQLVWEGMPDAYKDNGFLLLTKIDLLGGREAASGMYQRVAQRAAGEFRQVMPISAREAREATAAAKGIDRERFRESGAATLISTIKSRVQSARQADLDTAELLIARHADRAEPDQKPKFEPRAVDKPDDLASPDDLLAAEAAALRRVAAAAAEISASSAPSVSEPEDKPRNQLVSVVPPSPSAMLDPFPEPRPDVDEPEVDLSVIFGSEEHSAKAASDGAGDPSEAEAKDEAEQESPESDPPAIDRITPETGLHSLPDTSDPNHRFAARLRGNASEGGPAPIGLIPLKATWKSRHDTQSAMPIVPKPEPNRNPALRQLPEEVAREARLVGRGSRPGESPISGGAPGPLSDGGSAASGPGVSENGRVVEAEGDPSKAMPEPDRRTPKVTSVFASRARSEGLKGPNSEAGLPIAPTVDPEPRERDNSFAADISVPDTETQWQQKDPAFDIDEDTEEASPAETEPENPPEAVELRNPASSEAAQARQSLSARLGSQDRPVSVVKVSRLGVPLPDPQDIVAPRDERPNDRREAVSQMERRERPRIVPRVPSAVVEPDPSPASLPASEKALVESGIALIVSRSLELTDLIDPDDKPATDLILDHGLATVDQVLNVLSRGSSPVVRRICANLGEIQDLIMLMQLERGRAPADDALTLLLQLRREMETLCAG